MKKIFLSVLGIFLCTYAFAEIPFMGLYQTIDDETHLPKSIVRLYEYEDAGNSALAGRIVALYDEKGNISETIKNPVKLADKVSGSPKYVGLDIIEQKQTSKKNISLYQIDLEDDNLDQFIEKIMRDKNIECD